MIIEKYSSSVRFCIICNYINKINNALKSRCKIFMFNKLNDNNIKNIISS